MADSLFGFDSAFLQKLERLALLNRRPTPGPAAGPRRSPRHGASVEFADFRDYTSGDDFRRIDWNAYARLDRLFVRLYSAEEMAVVTLFLDHSASMGFGRPTKGLMAARLAAVLSYVALHNYDRVAVAGLGRTIDRYLPGQFAQASIPRVWRHIDGIMATPAGSTDLAALRQFGLYARGRGLAVVLTDLLSDSNWQSGLRGLRAAGQEVSVIQILAREDLEPEVRGDWKLVDSETGTGVDVTISPRVLRRYLEALEAHTEDIRVFCRRHDIAFYQLPSDADMADVVLPGLHVAGVIA